MLWHNTFLDSRFRGNDGHLAHLVIPAKAGIQLIRPNLLRSYVSSTMASIRRGDIFLVNFDPTVGAEAKKTRPALVVSNDVNNAHSPIVSISPITSNVKRVYKFKNVPKTSFTNYTNFPFYPVYILIMAMVMISFSFCSSFFLICLGI